MTDIVTCRGVTVVVDGEVLSLAIGEALPSGASEQDREGLRAIGAIGLANSAPDESEPSEESGDTSDLKSLKIDALRELADARGIDHSGLKKAELLDLLEHPAEPGSSAQGDGETPAPAE